MGLFSKMFSDARRAVNSYVGDDAFLKGVASALGAIGVLGAGAFKRYGGYILARA